MATKADRLTGMLGSNMAESLGSRNGTAVLDGPPRDVLPIASEDSGKTRNRMSGFMELENIVPDPGQVRKEFNEEELKNLAGSIKRYGILQPLIIEWRSDIGKHQIVAGERRYRAAKLAGLTSVPCLFKQEGELPEGERRRVQLTENCLREDLSPIEQAKAFDELMKIESFNAAQLAESLSVSKALVTQRLTLLTLPEDIKAKVEQGKLSGAAAYQVSRIDNPKAQKKVAEKIVSEGLSRDEAVATVKEALATGKAPKAKQGRPTTLKTYKAGNVTVSLKFSKKRVTKDDQIEALKATIEQIEAA